MGPELEKCERKPTETEFSGRRFKESLSQGDFVEAAFEGKVLRGVLVAQISDSRCFVEIEGDRSFSVDLKCLRHASSAEMSKAEIALQAKVNAEIDDGKYRNFKW